MAKTINIGLITDKINGIVVDTSIKCSSANFSNKSNRIIEYIVMHYTGTKNKDTAKNNCTYFKNGSRGSSAHIFVDDNNIGQSVELRDVAWHCGTSGTYYHKDCRNANSIGVEMCCTSGNYIVSEATQINAAYVCAYLCKMIGVDVNEVDTYVLMHYSVTHKSCPKQYVENVAEWVQFKTWVKNILSTGNHKGKKAETKNGSSTTTTTTTTAKTTTTKAKSNAIIKQGQKHASEFTGVKIKADGIVGADTRKMKAIVLQHAMNLDYGKTIAEDGVFGTKSKKKLGSHYIKKGEKQYMVTAAEILMELNGIDPNGVEKPGIYGNGLVGAAKKYFGGNGTKITASQFLKLIK